MKDTDPEALAAFINAAPQGYWLAYGLKDQQQHFEFLTGPGTLDLTYVAERQAVVLNMCSPDEPGLFTRLAGGSALAGWSVQATKAHTFRNGMAIDTFYLVHPKMIGAPKAAELNALRKSLEAALSGRIALKEISAKLSKSRSQRQSVMDRPPSARSMHPKIASGIPSLKFQGLIALVCCLI